MEKSIEQMIYEETDLRLKEMGSDDYKFPPKADSKDVAGIVIGIAVSLLLIILCMTEVIV